MIQNQVEHQFEVTGQPCHVVPRAARLVHGAIIYDGEPIVGGVGEERQDVQAADDTDHVLLEEFA